MTREKDGAQEIEKPRPEKLDKKECLEGGIYCVKCCKDVRKEKDQEVSIGWDKGEMVSLAGLGSLVVKGSQDEGGEGIQGHERGCVKVGDVSVQRWLEGFFPLKYIDITCSLL